MLAGGGLMWSLERGQGSEKRQKSSNLVSNSIRYDKYDELSF